jgi:hypothetical protein
MAQAPRLVAGMNGRVESRGIPHLPESGRVPGVPLPMERLRPSDGWMEGPVGRPFGAGELLGRPYFAGGFVNSVPATPTDNSQIWLRGIRQHRKQLEHIPIGVSEKERCSGHPSNHHGFVGRLPAKVERNNIRCSKTRWRVQQVRKIRPKGKVEAQPQWTSPHFPQTEHRVASPTDPIKGNPALPKYLREFQSQGLAEETHRALQVGNVQMAFEEIANRNHAYLRPHPAGSGCKKS